MPAKSTRDGVDSLAEDTALIRHYEGIADASRSMLEAAHSGDWDKVEQIESSCRKMIRALKQASLHAELSKAESKRRMELLRAILSYDAQIRLRSEPWLRDLEEILSPAPNRERRTP